MPSMNYYFEVKLIKNIIKLKNAELETKIQKGELGSQ